MLKKISLAGSVMYITFIIMAHTKHFIYVYPKVEQKLAPGLEVISTEFGKKAGKVTTALGCNGMGVLRLEQWDVMER
ncbi:hypothetical protein QYF36_002128 [Acer negundo]|nr:hypothetical protein QYF36_002128 [Acer negundo]